jgi:hypothetical protein
VVANVPPRLRIENLSLRLLERHHGEPSNPFVLGTRPPTPLFHVLCIDGVTVANPAPGSREMSQNVRPEESRKMSLIAAGGCLIGSRLRHLGSDKRECGFPW